MKTLSRKRAIISHFLLSLAIVLSVLSCVYFFWYPTPYFQIIGAADVLKTLIGVDLVLGPALTALVYKPGKKSLWFDMSVIAALQLGALIYGVSVLYAEKPQFVVFSVDRFVVVARTELYPSSDVAVPACQENWRGPCEVAAFIPEDMEAREALLVLSVDNGIELEHQPAYWYPLDEHAEAVLSKAKPLQDLSAQSATAKQIIDRFAADNNMSVDGLRYLPVVNRRLQAMTWVMDGKTAERLGVIGVDPWQPDGVDD